MGDTEPGKQSGNGTGASRAKRSETRFCRVPQWLYSVGISLQAIAAYGWLHGKYGYLKRINPSYATLAEELGVSRGSIINYFKELVRVGAVRVTVGGPKGRTINSYEIAFDAPFAFSSGQPADHSGADHESVVSPLTTTGQPADQTGGPSGQPVVPEEEVIKKFEDSLSSDAPEPAAPAPPAASERETEAAPGKATAAQRAVRAGGVVSVAEEQAFIDWVRAKYPPAGAPFWKQVAENGDIPGLVVAWRADQPMRQAGPQPRVTVHDTSGRDHECRSCDRPIKPDAVDGLCRDCREDPSQTAS